MLQERAMIANLTIHQWTGQRTDKRVADDIDQRHGATNAGRYTKWIVDKGELESLLKHTSKMRDVHTEMTLPWGDNGDRLLPSRMYMKYTDRMRELKAEREALAKDFAAKYPALVVGNAQRLGTLYDAKDYPSSAHIESRFGIDLSFLPVPAADDFRVDVGNEAVAEIKESISKAVAERQDAAAQDCWARITEVADKIVERLDDPKAIFRDSLIENAQVVAEIIPDLNLNDDAALARACEKLRELSDIQPETLRRNFQVRRMTCEAARDLLVFIKANKA